MSESEEKVAAQTENLDPTKAENIAVVKSGDVGGHTFVVTTVVTESKEFSNASVETLPVMLAVPVDKPHEVTCNKAKTTTVTHTERQTQTAFDDAELPTTSKAIVPLSSCLPSKLLRFHAKRSAQALLHQVEQFQSLDSQFGSDEGAIGGNDCNTNEVSIASPPPPSSTPVEGLEDKLIDVGMGSSIEDSEESMEEDDELKPLAVDNHVLYDVDLSSSPVDQMLGNSEEALNANTAVLSEANLEKFHKNQNYQNANFPNMDNIYLHPNFKYQLEEKELDFETSPPPAVAPANSPTQQKRVHRSFLTMKKPNAAIDAEVEKASSVISHATTASYTEAPHSDGPVINEIDNLDPALIPCDELAAEIAEAVEFYFSNESILKDAFLLKHVRRNKEGFVSLKLVSSFKRVRQLTKEWKVVGNAVRRKSRKIELNDVGTKVRRIDPLPNFDETMPSRTIVACDLPLDKLSIEKVSDIFSKCGEIALIRILKPGMAIPVDVRQFMNKYPELQQKECALVEYLESSSAREAKDLQGPFTVFEMVAPKKKTGKKAIVQITAPVARMVENYRYYNDATYERTRGGSFSGIVPHNEDLRFKLRRNNSDFPTKTLMDMHQHHGQQPVYQYHHHNSHPHQHSPTHRGSFGSGDYTHHFQNYQSRGSISHDPGHLPAMNHATAGTSPGAGGSAFYAYSPRRYSNTSTLSANTATGHNPDNSTPVNVMNNNNSHSSHNVGCINNNHNSNSNNNNNNINNNNGSVLTRRLSNCSDSYSGFSELSRRPSNCSDNVPQRRDSNCSDNCPCSRRISDFGQTEVYRKTSQSSIGSGGERRFSNGSLQFERTYSNASDLGNGNNGVNSGNGFQRRMSNDYNYERKPSLESQSSVPYDDGNVGGGGGGYNVFPRRYSNNFNISSKLAAYDNAQYINGRRISTDSGYDRRCSFGSEYEGSPRSRTSSFLNNYKHGLDYDGQPRSRTGSFLDNTPRSRSGSFAQRAAESLVRTPIGPDGSKGFGSRARKLGQTVSPVN